MLLIRILKEIPMMLKSSLQWNMSWEVSVVDVSVARPEITKVLSVKKFGNVIHLRGWCLGNRIVCNVLFDSHSCWFTSIALRDDGKSSTIACKITEYWQVKTHHLSLGQLNYSRAHLLAISATMKEATHQFVDLEFCSGWDLNFNLSAANWKSHISDD